jgi:hypothetical protein
MARKMKPEATTAMSKTAMCLSQMVYATVTAKYPATTARNAGLMAKAIANPPSPSTTPVATASRGLTIPAAIGRLRFVG